MGSIAQGPLNFIITGAGRGIGRGLSRLLHSKGHRLFLLDTNSTELKQAVTLLQGAGSPPGHALCDLRSPSEIKQALNAAHKHFSGKLDCLINNAANTATGVGAIPFEQLSLEEWNNSIETNLTAPFLLSQACVPMLKASGGGLIINMSSTRAHQSEPNSEGYASSKAGLIGLTHSMACSLSNTGIRVNTILPGWIHVANECKAADDRGVEWEQGLSKEDHRWHWTGRVGKVEDIHRAVEYLLGADFVTGQELVVDGGVTRRMVYPE